VAEKIRQIKILRTPAGEGYLLKREYFIGCIFAIEGKQPIARPRAGEFTEAGPEELVYQVAFIEVVDGLRRGGKDDWADYWENIRYPPTIVYFPIDCC